MNYKEDDLKSFPGDIFHRVTMTSMMADFSSGTVQGRRQWNSNSDVFTKSIWNSLLR
jgi:hypothetical protein